MPNGIDRPLVYLNLRNTPVPDALLRYIVSRSPYLTELFCESCNMLTDYSVMKLANNCHNLKVLDLSFCDLVSDVSLQIFTLQASSTLNGITLEELYLSACDLITPLGIHQLVQKCLKLQLLVLDGCEKILGSFVHDMATYKEDGITCTFEEQDIKCLAQYVCHVNPPNTIHTLTLDKCELSPPGTPKKEMTLPVVIRRDSNRSLRARKSTLNIDFKDEDEKYFADAILNERQQKIREKWGKWENGNTPDNKTVTASVNLPTEMRTLQARHSTSVLMGGKDSVKSLRRVSMAPIQEIEQKKREMLASKSKLNPKSQEFKPSIQPYNIYNESEQSCYDQTAAFIVDQYQTHEQDFSPAKLDWASYPIEPHYSSPSEYENLEMNETFANIQCDSEADPVRVPSATLNPAKSPETDTSNFTGNSDWNAQWGMDPEIWCKPSTINSNSSTLAVRKTQSTVFVDPWESKIRPESFSAAERTLRKSQSQLFTQTRSSQPTRTSPSRLSTCSGWAKSSSSEVSSPSSDRGPLLLKLAVETKLGTHELLPIHQVQFFNNK